MAVVAVKDSALLPVLVRAFRWASQRSQLTHPRSQILAQKLNPAAGKGTVDLVIEEDSAHAPIFEFLGTKAGWNDCTLAMTGLGHVGKALLLQLSSLCSLVNDDCVRPRLHEVPVA